MGIHEQPEPTSCLSHLEMRAVFAASTAVVAAACGFYMGRRQARKHNSSKAVLVITAPECENADLDDAAGDVHTRTAVDVVDTLDVKIRELFGGASSGNPAVSIAHVTVKRTCSEEWQRPAFDEWTLVLKGVVRIERAAGTSFNVRAGEAVFLPCGELVRWVFPDPTDLPEYIAICRPAFSPDNCGRGTEPPLSLQPEYEAFPRLFHAAPKAAWEAAVAAGKPYVPDTYEADGFVHATAKPDVLIPVLNQFYRDVPGDFVCLHMERTALAEQGIRVRFEFPAPVGEKPTFEKRKYNSMLFPHIYSPISALMVSQVSSIHRSASGEFLSADI